MNEVCEKCKTCGQLTHPNGVCIQPTQSKPCQFYMTEEEIEADIRRFYSKLGTWTGD